MRCFFFFQAEDGIRDGHVTGVQTCALPISGDGSTVFMSRDDGTVWRFTMPQQLSFTDCCSAASPAGTCDPHTEVRGSRVTLPSTVQGVISIAPDPFDSGSLFAVVPSATDQNRVRHLKY